MSTDENDDEPSETESLPELPAAERRLVTQAYDLSVSTLVEQWSDETLILPDIQREYVWRSSKASRLIESLLLNVPIPVLYLAEASEDRYEVIDGHQRIKSIARYVNNEFALTGLQVLTGPGHRGKRFHKLAASDQRRIKTRVIRAIIITEESHPTMKFEVFERLNAGATALTAQEIRNSSYRGPFMTLVHREWVLNKDFRSCIGTKSPRGRMVDEELVIRILAMRERLDDYRPPLPRFLNAYSADANKLSGEALADLGDVFARASRNVHALYGSAAFRLTDSDGQVVDRNINRGLVEAQLVTLSFARTEDVIARRTDLQRRLGELHSNPDFLDDIRRAIVDRSRTVGRMSAYRQACKEAGLPLHEGS